MPMIDFPLRRLFAAIGFAVLMFGCTDGGVSGDAGMGDGDMVGDDADDMTGDDMVGDDPDAGMDDDTGDMVGDGDDDPDHCPDYPDGPAAMTECEPLPRITWPEYADMANGSVVAETLDTLDATCGDDTVFDPFEVLLFISIPAW